MRNKLSAEDMVKLRHVLTRAIERYDGGYITGLHLAMVAVDKIEEGSITAAEFAPLMDFAISLKEAVPDDSQGLLTLAKKINIMYMSFLLE